MARGTNGWNDAELVKPSPIRPASPRAARRAASTASLGPRQDRPGVVEQRLSRRGQFDAARLAAKQHHVEFAFQRANLLRQRRLLDAEPLGGAGDMALFGDRYEVAQVTQFHMY